MAEHVVIIGGVAAGPKAAARIKRCNPSVKVTVLEQGTHLSYAGCGLPFYIGGMVEKEEELMTTPVGVVRSPAFFKAVKDVDILTGTRADKIDRRNKKVVATNLSTGETLELTYDKLVLATGSSPFKPPLPGLDLDGVFTLSNPVEASQIKERVKKEGINNIVIIGAGLIGLELAETIGALEGTNVSVVELMDWVLPGLLDQDMALLVGRHMRQKGINLMTSTRVQRLEGGQHVSRVITDQGELPADMVIVAAGVKPNVKLAEEAGLELGSTGAIKVNERMQTSDPDIFAGGDCVENIHLITGKPVYTPMGSVANRHGRVVGDNVCGGTERFPGVLGTAIVKVFQFNVGRTGLSQAEAEKLGFTVESFICPAPDRAHFYPGANPVMIKLVADKSTRKLLGAQIIGPGAVDKRLDVVASALAMGATVDQLAVFDLAYSPPFSTALDALTHAANSLRNKLDGLAKSLNPLEVRRKMSAGEEFLLLDVRTPGEYQEVRFPYDNVVFIPLGKLRERAGELPKDRPVIIFCKVSMRGYEAQRILEGLGFDNVYFLEGGIATWPFELDNTPQK